MRTLRFHKTYFLAFIVLLAIEVYIALQVNDTIIRPFVGDVLVVVLLYCGVSAFAKADKKIIAYTVLGLAYLIEFLQATTLIEILGIQDNTFANIILGNTFDWMDILAYTAGACLILIFDDRKD